jgi:transcriptional regulator with XRE-family HTH domain
MPSAASPSRPPSAPPSQGPARPAPKRPARAGVGPVLRQWREQRHLSQLALATEAGISPRHLSFVETGKSVPSRQTILLLADVLAVPARERNQLLVAAGFAPVYTRAEPDSPAHSEVERAVRLMLTQQEPWPAIAIDRHWNVVRANTAMTRLLGLLLGEGAVAAALADATRPLNAMRLVFQPQGLRPCIVNWEETASALIQWLHRDHLRTGDEALARLLHELLAYPDVPREWRSIALAAPTAPFLAVTMAHGDATFAFFTVLASLGTPYDLTLQELRVESFYPADAATEVALRTLAGDVAAPQ